MEQVKATNKKEKISKGAHEYTSAPLAAIWKENNAFFAFGDQLDAELLKRNLTRDEVCSLGYGLIAPKVHAKKIKKDMVDVASYEIKARLADMGKEGIIEYELHNRECFYISDYSEIVEDMQS
jgi:hypothetical protein